MRDLRQCRSPGVEHGGDADPCTQMARIGSDRQHRLGRRLEQQVIDRGLVVERDVGEFGGNAEHDVEVSDRQQVSLALGQPGARGGALALGAVPVAAAVIGDAPMAAVLAGLGGLPSRRPFADIRARLLLPASSTVAHGTNNGRLTHSP